MARRSTSRSMARRMASAPPWEALTPQTKSKPHCGELCLQRVPPATLWHIFYSIVDICTKIESKWEMLSKALETTLGTIGDASEMFRAGVKTVRTASDTLGAAPSTPTPAPRLLHTAFKTLRTASHMIGRQRRVGTGLSLRCER